MPESRKRKPKKKPARPGRPRLAPSAVFGPFELLDDHEVARGFRRSCSECGSASITWHRLGDAPDAARLESQRAAAVGFLVNQGLDADTQYWACDVCSNCGAFGPMGEPDVALAPWGL